MTEGFVEIKALSICLGPMISGDFEDVSKSESLITDSRLVLDEVFVSPSLTDSRLASSKASIWAFWSRAAKSAPENPTQNVATQDKSTPESNSEDPRSSFRR